MKARHLPALCRFFRAVFHMLNDAFEAAPGHVEASAPVKVETIFARIARKLGLSNAELNALFSACPVDGYTGHLVRKGLDALYGLDPAEALGEQMIERGVLTLAEGRWLDDSGQLMEETEQTMKEEATMGTALWARDDELPPNGLAKGAGGEIDEGPGPNAE